MDAVERREESERLRSVLMHVHDHLEIRIGHLEEDVLPPRMAAASEHHLMDAAMACPALVTKSEHRPAFIRPNGSVDDSVPMRVVHVWDMRVRMTQALVPVRMGMRFT